jgi:outer membrane receptor protein involved in Fe transport
MRNPSLNVRDAVRFALAAAATTAATPLVYAQTAPAPAPVEEVVITGSRLMQAPNDISISPITSVSAEDIRQSGLVRVDDILGNLPSVTTEAPQGTSISTNGINTVSLRDLGSQRTLVLINGRRMQPGGAGGVVGPGGNANAPDINQIPAELIERADVLTGGASAVYGADAVAGVVNFVLNTHYQGIKVDTDYGYNNHSNSNSTYVGYLQNSPYPIALPSSTVNTGQNRSASIVAGANFADGLGNATAYVTYLNSGPAVGSQFDHAGCTLNGGSTVNGPIQCGGSSTSATGRFRYFGATAGGSTRFFSDTAARNGFVRFTNAYRYNYGALSYFSRPAERWTAGGFLHYDANEHAQIYSETMYARNTSQAQFGPDAMFAYQDIVTGCNNPLLSSGPFGQGPGSPYAAICQPARLTANQTLYGLPVNTNLNPALGPVATFDVSAARRNIEGGGRQNNFTSNAIRQVLGVKGKINDIWNYDAYAQYGTSELGLYEGDYIGTLQLERALDVIPNPAVGGVKGVAAGAPVCRAALPGGIDAACVPWNIWNYGGVTKAQEAYLGIPATYDARATEYVADGSVTGDLGKYGVKLPTANSGLNVNIGTEYRQETFVFNPDFIYINGLTSGTAGGTAAKAIPGSAFRLWEGFTELRLPLIEEKPGAYNLSFDAGYRYSSYTLGFNTNTYKMGLEWAPIQDVRLRGGYNRAVRVPNLDELYLPATVGAGGTADPCWGSQPTFSPAQCARTGVDITPTAGHPNGDWGFIATNPAAQINTQVGGSPTLTPEIADTYTLGLVFQPHALSGFVATLDTFSIKIKNTITSLSSNTIINNCALYGTASLCALINRGHSAGQRSDLWEAQTNYVTATTQNIGINSTKGADLTGRYRLNMAGMGTLNFALVGTYVRDFLTAPVAALPAFDCVGYWGATCGAPLPKWRHVLNTTWATPWAGLNATVRWRYLGASAVDRTSPDPQLNLVPAGAPLLYYHQTAHIPAYNYLDLAFAVPLGRMADFRLGVNNIADKNPPLILNGSFSDCPNSSCNDNTWVGTYDTLGRYIYAHLTAKF